MEQTNEKNAQNKTDLRFLAIDPFVESNIVEPVEVYIKDKSFVGWGETNNYPDYIESLYQNVATLHSIIDGTTDYICGDKVNVNIVNFETRVNSKGHTMADLISWVAKDLVKFNGFALNIVKNKYGSIAEIYYLDFKRIRSNKEGTKFYYSADWGGKSYGRAKYFEYDSFLSEEGQSKSSTIFYYKNDINKVYPTPMYGAAVIACETESKISEYHLNNLSNAFASNCVININSGKPSSEQQEEIERNLYDKFCGTQNAGRPVISYNNGKEQETTIANLNIEGFADKYNALTTRTKQEIFTAFRCSPILFGIDQEKTGFNANEYASVFRLYNKTVVEPMQNKIAGAFDKIFGQEKSIVIEPFTINFDKEIDA